MYHRCARVKQHMDEGAEIQRIYTRQITPHRPECARANDEFYMRVLKIDGHFFSDKKSIDIQTHAAYDFCRVPTGHL